MYGDVNISAILDSFSGSYDKRVRPNYGGESTQYVNTVNTVSINYHIIIITTQLIIYTPTTPLEVRFRIRYIFIHINVCDV